MAYRRSAIISGSSYSTVLLRCGDLRKALLALCMTFWMFSLVFVCQMAADSDHPEIAEWANAIIQYLGDHTFAFMLGPALIAATLLWFHFSRTELSWSDGLLIDASSVEVVHYQFKRTITNAPMIYIKTTDGLYILYAATSQDGKRLSDGKQAAKEAADNEIQIERLKNMFENSNATENKFRFFSKDVVISLIVFIVIIAMAL